MREHDAIELPSAPFDAISPMQGLSSYLPTIGAIALGGLIAFGVVASGAGTPVLVIMLGVLATIGLSALFAYSGGYLRIGRRAPLADLVRAGADSMDVGVMIASREGEPKYANAAFAAIVGNGERDSVAALQQLLARDANASAALFRLTRSAERGEPLTEEFSVASSVPGSRKRNSLQLSVSPIAPAEAAGDVPLVLWRLSDVTAERRDEAARIAGIEVQLSQFDNAPIGFASVGVDGALLRVNATLARWIGRSAKHVVEQRLTLADIASGDGAALLPRLAAGNGEQLEALDVDLIHEDGRVMPVRLLARAAPSGKGATIAVVDLAGEAAAEFDGDASGARFARFFQSAPFGIAMLGSDGRIVSANSAFCRMVLDGAAGTGMAAADALARAADPTTRLAVEEGLKRVISGRAHNVPIDITSGTKRDLVTRVYMSPFATGGVREAAILYVVDATEQKALEARFAQSQKMEVVGKLAGGIAHDFNNMLTAILGFSDMLLGQHRRTDVAYKDIKNIQASANRAAELVRKLLALARQQTLQNEVINLADVLTDQFNMLKGYLGEKSELRISTAPDLWNVKVDQHEFEQALFNLITNSKDAMSDGGTLTIRARNVPERETQKFENREFAPGEYVLIEVSDTGQGMSREVMDKIFEPFFTTKAIGKGTGLGLASVYGMVKQSGGYIYPDSDIGKGTTFRIYLPRHHADKDDEVVVVKEKKKEQKAADLTGTGRVLLVEDEEVVRNFAARALKRQGYKVLEAASGVEALEVMEKHKGKVDIVVSDVVMPEMDGPTLLKELRKTNPDIKIIFVSGYPNDAFKSALGDENFAFLPKPFSLPQLAAKVKEELGR
ncbi:MAG: response regulator [Hyphomicrobium sp.]|jgi:two-component system cell cycle sensor histidine kinase/response regulator CckA